MGKVSLLELIISILIIVILSIIVLRGVVSIVEKVVNVKAQIELKYNDMFILD